MFIDKTACEKLNLDPKKVSKIASKLSKAANEAEHLGLTITTGPDGGALCHHPPYTTADSQLYTLIAYLDGHYVQAPEDQ